jgi:tetratricopeptide (TPR) repeat protein
MEKHDNIPDFPQEEKALSLAQQGKVEEALDCYDRALTTNPDNDVILNNKAIALISLGRFEAALRDTKKAADINPEAVDVWINMGVALDKLGRFHEASEALERAVTISPYNAYARALLGIIYQKMDMDDRAEVQNRKLQEIVFPKGYAGLYFAIAAFMLGILLGGVRVVEGKPVEVSIGSQTIIFCFFCVICGLYWRSLRMWQQINRNVIMVPYPSPVREEHATKGMYFVIVAMIAVFIIGVFMGGDVWMRFH